MRPCRTSTQQCPNMRTLRRNSSERSVVIFSSATRPRRVDGAEAALDHQVREREVVAEARVDLLVALAAHRVDRAVAAGHRVHERLARPQPDLVAPVGALLVRALGRAQLQPAADVGDRAGRRAARRAARSASGLPLRSWRPRTPRRRRRERAHGDVLGVDLAAAGRAHELDAAVGVAAHDARRCRRSRRPRRRRCAAARAGSRARARSRAWPRSRRPRCRPRSRARRAAGSPRPRAPGAGAGAPRAAMNSG